ncbi:MAG: hypothetical protein QNJ98_17310, partial [Planctomycetota bacterium]|nr:hypothetical protein [Planctomycetota bacterium]
DSSDPPAVAYACRTRAHRNIAAGFTNREARSDEDGMKTRARGKSGLTPRNFLHFGATISL